MYDDAGGYLERWPAGTLGFGRSAAYGLLLWVTRGGWFVPAIVLQAGVTAWIVGRALKIFGLARSPWTIGPVTALLAASGGVAFFCSQVGPDAWAAPAVLALHLLAWHPDRLSRVERLAAGGLIAFAGASHMATFGVLVGLALVYLLAWVARRRLGITPHGACRALAATASGLLLLLAVDAAVAGRWALTPGGEVFLFARLTESGLVAQTLREHCPREEWQLCQYREVLPPIADDLLWRSDSVLWKIGGWNDGRARAEIRSIITRSALDHPLAHVRNAVALSAEQFVTLGTANAMAPIASSHLGFTLETYAPWLVEPYKTSRQQGVPVDLTTWSAWLVVPVNLAAVFALPFVAVGAWRNHRRAAMLPAAVFIALAGNAFICGVFSGPHDRYQARLAWLAPLSVVVTLTQVRRYGVAGGGEGG